MVKNDKESLRQTFWFGFCRQSLQDILSCFLRSLMTKMTVTMTISSADCAILIHAEKVFFMKKIRSGYTRWTMHPIRNMISCLIMSLEGGNPDLSSCLWPYPDRLTRYQVCYTCIEAGM